jgi:hypothetical protein
LCGQQSADRPIKVKGRTALFVRQHIRRELFKSMRFTSACEEDLQMCASA